MSNKYYKLVIQFNNDAKYKSIELDIPMFPKIKVPNILFTNLMKVGSSEELQKIGTNTILFYGEPPNNTNKLGKCKVTEISKNDFIKNVSLYALRQLMDLQLIKYYLDLKVIPINANFIDRFSGHYDFYVNPSILDNVFPEGPNKQIRNIDKKAQTVLYCIFFSPQYEHIGYTLRTHSLLKSVKDAGVNIIGVSRYGYPFDKPKEYYSNGTNLKDSNPYDCYQKDGVKYIKLLDGTDNFNDNSIIDYIKKYVIQLVKAAKEYNATIIHGASNWFNGISAFYAGRILGIPSVYEVRGFWDESSVALRPELIGSDMIKLKEEMENFVIDRVNKVITINDNLKNEIINRVEGIKDISVICNGVDSEKFNIDETVRETMRKKFGLSDKTTVIGYIGSLLNYEGLDYILHSIKRLTYVTHVKFFMIGDGKEKDNLLRLATNLMLGKDQFEYIGKINHDDVSKFYNMFDIVVYPRRNDKVCQTTSSSKIFETMCMAKPIIVSKLPAYDEIIVDRYNGLYCKADSIDDICNKIKELIDDLELRETIGRNAREWVIKNREWKGLGQELIRIYNNILEK